MHKCISKQLSDIKGMLRTIKPRESVDEVIQHIDTALSKGDAWHFGSPTQSGADSSRVSSTAHRVKEERDRAQTATAELNEELAFVEGKLEAIQLEESMSTSGGDSNVIVQRIKNQIIHHRESSSRGGTDYGPPATPTSRNSTDSKLAEAEKQLEEIQELYFEERMRRQLLESEISSLRSPCSVPSSMGPIDGGETAEAIIKSDAASVDFSPTTPRSSKDSPGWYSELFADELTMLASAKKFMMMTTMRAFKPS